MKHGKDCISGWYWIGNLDTGFKVPCITVPEYVEKIRAYGTRLLRPEEFSQYNNIINYCKSKNARKCPFGFARPVQSNYSVAEGERRINIPRNENQINVNNYNLELNYN